LVLELFHYVVERSHILEPGRSAISRFDALTTAMQNVSHIKICDSGLHDGIMSMRRSIQRYAKLVPTDMMEIQCDEDVVSVWYSNDLVRLGVNCREDMLETFWRNGT
jgi:hypothetical protein